LRGLFEHEADEGDDMEVCEGAGIAFVVFDETTAAGRPGEGALDHPAPWPPGKAAFGLGSLDDLPIDAVIASGLGRLLDGVPGDGLHGLRQTPDLGAVVGIGGRDVQGQEMAQRVDSQMDFRAFLAFGTIVACALAALG
jgi:hypothetical protein